MGRLPVHHRYGHSSGLKYSRMAHRASARNSRPRVRNTSRIFLFDIVCDQRHKYRMITFAHIPAALKRNSADGASALKRSKPGVGKH